MFLFSQQHPNMADALWFLMIFLFVGRHSRLVFLHQEPFFLERASCGPAWHSVAPMRTFFKTLLKNTSRHLRGKQRIGKFVGIRHPVSYIQYQTVIENLCLYFMYVPVCTRFVNKFPWFPVRAATGSRAHASLQRALILLGCRKWQSSSPLEAEGRQPSFSKS